MLTSTAAEKCHRIDDTAFGRVNWNRRGFPPRFEKKAPAFGEITHVDNFWEIHGGQVLILVLAVLVLGTLVILVPQLLRSRQKRQEMQHLEHMRALEQGMEIPPSDDPSWAAGMTAMLVPMVVVITAGTVTCFLAGNRSEDLFSVTMAVWGVAGVVSLAAITGGVALIGRLAQLRTGEEDEEKVPHNPLAGPS
jgi:hypothetical protein